VVRWPFGGAAAGDRARRRLAARIRGAIDPNVALVSSNCVGSRLSQLSGAPYQSPTVNLWMWPGDFLTLVEGLPDRLSMPVREDAAESQRFGYPVGRLGELALMFQHNTTFAEAAADWSRRARRAMEREIVVVFTDRDGATDDDFARFERLPHRKVALTARPRGASSLAVPGCAGRDCVGDLYTDWHLLEPVLTPEVTGRVFGP